jgi:hypothetical protein
MTYLRASDVSDGTALLFLDLSAAFDTIDHRVLLDRLSGSGIRGAALGWFGSYLSDRSQSVIVDFVTSDPMVLECGVPQGSVLGPLLFLVYVAALPDETHINGVVVDQFSDDTYKREQDSLSGYHPNKLVPLLHLHPFRFVVGVAKLEVGEIPVIVDAAGAVPLISHLKQMLLRLYHRGPLSPMSGFLRTE